MSDSRRDHESKELAKGHQGAAVRINEFGQPIGRDVAEWEQARWPVAEVMEGRWCRLERLSGRHVEDLFQAFEGDDTGWTYLSYGPFANVKAFEDWVLANCESRDPMFYAILVRDGSAMRAKGVASYLRIMPAAGSVEVGHIHFGSALQKTPAATDAMYLMARHAFESGFRRYEWKCDALNLPSRAAAQRFGFSFEGVFRNAAVYKRRSRDTAWYAMTDADWVQTQLAYERWLSAGNLEGGGQRERLSNLTRGGLRNICDPFTQ